jgi:glycosyltransferase involved in cell wall biosynthesis
MADAVGNVSQGAVNDLAKLALLDPVKLHVLHNPIPARPASSELALEQARATWGNGAGAKLLTVGSFKTVKNHALLLRAFAHLVSNVDARLMLLGDGELRPELEQLARQLGIADRVIFPGFQNPPTPFYETADLFVLSSNSEGLPTVLIEAMACGLPVVSTDCPYGPAEILEDGKYGALVPVGDEGALAAAMQIALNTPVDSDALKLRAADFAPEIAARRYLELLA